MLDIDFKYSNEAIRINFSLDDSKEKIFYILLGKEKIYINYPKDNYLIVPKKIIEDKKVFFQLYWKGNSERKSFKSDLIVFNKIDKNLYSSIIIYNRYDGIKSKGYSSVDNKVTININNNINWLTVHRNFNFNINAWRFLSYYWGEFFKDFKLNILNEIVNIMVQYYSYMVGERSIGNNFVWYDMAVGIRALHISLALNLKYFLSNEQVNILESLYQVHLEKLLEEEFFSLNNHGIWQIYGLRSLLHIKNDTNKSALDYCNRRFSELVDFSFNDEGIHTENSPFYHQYVINLFRAVPKKFLQENQKIKFIVANSSNFSAWLSDCNQRFFQIGDTEGYNKATLNIKSLQSDFYDKEIKSVSKVFFDSGYFVTKAFNQHNKCISELIFYNTSGSFVHKHLDGNAFIFMYKNVELFADGGKYIYDYSDFRKYFLSFSAHNTVYPQNSNLTVKDLNLIETKFLDFKINECYQMTSVVTYNDIFQHTRKLNYYVNEKIVIEDSVNNESDSNNILNFVFGNDVDLIDSSGEGNFRLKSNNILLAKIYLPTGFISYKIYRGSKNPYRGWISKEYSKFEPVYCLEVVYPSTLNLLKTEIALY